MGDIMAVFKKKAPQEPEKQDTPPVYVGGKQQQAQGPSVDVEGAIDEFNRTFGGMFPPGDSSNNQALLFAIYTELREMRK